MPSLHALAAAIFCVALVAITATDIEHRLVPNKVVLPAAAVVLALQLAAWRILDDLGGLPRASAQGCSSSSPHSPTPAAWGWGT